MRKSLLLALPLVFSTVIQVTAQTPTNHDGPPRVLLFVREDIKPGMMSAHNKHSATYASIFSKLQTSNHRIAMVPVAGSENEVVYLTAADTFAEVEKTLSETDKKMETVNASMQAELGRLDKEAGVLHSGMRDILAIYRPELSFNPKAEIPKMRYFSVTTVRIRPGHDAQYGEYVQKILNVARTKAKLPDTYHVAVYQVISGAPSGTLLVFRPMKSLSEFDTAIGPMVRNAMSDDEKKEVDKIASDAVLSTETSTYSFRPGMSYLPKEFTAADPGFWTPKAQVATKPKPKRITTAEISGKQ